MFLRATSRRNPTLIKAAVEFHQQGIIPPNTYLVDLDTFKDNVRKVVSTAKVYGLSLYHMTKQQGRNPILAKAAEEAGLEKIVAVDFAEAKALYRHGARMGHLGHLVNIPKHMIPVALKMQPEVITVYSLDKAKQIAEVAEALGICQELLVRVYNESDTYYPSQIGGIPLEDLADSVKKINSLPGVKVAGLTNFPCILFNYEKQIPEATPNLYTLQEAAELLQRTVHIELKQINAPSLTCAATIPLLAEAGATHGEPGSCLTGNTPLHAFDDEQPEIPAMGYVSEVSHVLYGKGYAFGGGFYPRGRFKEALVGENPETIISSKLQVEPDPPEVIDYHGTLVIGEQKNIKPGDTVVYAFRAQVFVSRSYVGVVEGLHSGSKEKWRLVGLHNQLGYEVNREELFGC